MDQDQQELRSTPLVFHDYFAIRGGGERLVLTLAEALNAHIYFGFTSPKSFPPEDFPAQNTNLNLTNSARRPGLRPVLLAALFRRQRANAAQYALRVFSGVAAPFAAPKMTAGGKNIFYCHTPPRFLYDQKTHFMRRIPLLLRPIAWPVLGLFEWGYRRAISRMHVIVTNSKNTQARLKKFTGHNSTVVYPPIEIEKYKWKGQSDYYLSTARLSPLKRVEHIIDAFLEIPDKKLVIASGGDELEALQKRAAGAKNIRFCGWTSDDELQDLVGNAIATIYLPHDEDFGMSPVESMAAGKPVIGVAEGGLLETIIDGETGMLLPTDFCTANLIDAITSMDAIRAKSMRGACSKQAARFSKETFIRAMRALTD